MYMFNLKHTRKINMSWTTLNILIIICKAKKIYMKYFLIVQDVD